MASTSELGIEKVAAKWVVGPTEDVVQALMETLVDPLLPLRPSIEPPSIDAQKSISTQMHAVVLLYNYHHRKHKPELKFLDLPYFCQLAVVIRPPLIAFMKLFKESESMDLNGTEDQLSLTEKAMKDACDISMALDASKDVPDIEGWPISKVAILLIDSKKEYGFVQFGAITKGTWSLIEIEINESNINQELSLAKKFGNKRKWNSQKGSTNDDEFLQLMYDPVKDATGINSSDLEVLETHVTYSSSKKMSAARLYMIQYCGCFSTKEQVHLETVVKSLQGPLAEKLQYGFWRSTLAVEYHHLLPYAEFISCWLSRKDLCVPSSKPDLDHIYNSSSEMEMLSSEKIVKNEKCVLYTEILDKKSDESHMGMLSSPSTGHHMSEFTDTLPKSENTIESLGSIIKVYQRRKKNTSDARKDGIVLKVDMKSCDTQCRDEKLSIHNENRIVETREQLVEYNVQVQSAPASQESQNALQLLHKLREELCSKICGMEDTLASYEDIIARIRDGGEVGLARQCIESIEIGNDDLLPEHENQIEISETYTPGRSSCRDLEHICMKNNWRHPRYSTELSAGKFISNVVVGRKDHKFSSTGRSETKPCEARESAAANMIAKLRNSGIYDQGD